MSYIYLNGNIIHKNNFILNKKNRAFFYGDGLFETINVFNGKVFNYDAHWQRIKYSCSVLELDFKKSKEMLLDDISNILIKKNKIDNGKIKLILFRDTLGKYLPKSNNTSIYISIEPSIKSNFSINQKGLKIDWYHNEYKTRTKLSNIKTLNSLVYILASKYAIRNNLDDVILFNDLENVIETTSSNIFIVEKNNLVTPKLNQGCVMGTFRELILKNSKSCKEEILNKKRILNADELFITNSSGLKWVESLAGKKFKSKIFSKKLIEQINNLI